MQGIPKAPGAIIWRSIWKSIASINTWFFCWTRSICIFCVSSYDEELLFFLLLVLSETFLKIATLSSVILFRLGLQKGGCGYYPRNIQHWHSMQASISLLARYTSMWNLDAPNCGCCSFCLLKFNVKYDGMLFPISQQSVACLLQLWEAREKQFSFLSHQ